MKVDVHAHYIPVSCIDLESVDRAEQTYQIRVTRAGSDEVLHAAPGLAKACDPEDLYRVERRLAVMAEQYVDVHVLSLPPFAFFYELEPERGLAVCQRFNQTLAETAQADPARFLVMASVPLQAPEVAARELERAVRELGLRGVEIGTNIAGKNLDEPELRPFYAKAQELDVPIFIHPFNVLGADRLRNYYLNNLIGNPTDDALAAASLIFGGVLKEFPRLKVYIAHGGGSCPFLRGRWDHGWRVRPEARIHIQRPPSEYFAQLMFDTITHSGPALNYLVETVGPERVLMGTDYPFDMGDTDPVKTVASLPHLSDRERELILGENAAALFKLG